MRSEISKRLKSKTLKSVILRSQNKHEKFPHLPNDPNLSKPESANLIRAPPEADTPRAWANILTTNPQVWRRFKCTTPAPPSKNIPMTPAIPSTVTIPPTRTMFITTAPYFPVDGS
jgi:hypothetical protein